MNKKVLVAYGSKRGSIAEIAARIGETLKQKGLTVDVLEAGTVKDLTPYNKIILGSAVYIGLWHKQAVRFLKNNIEALEKLPVWLFISGPTGPGNPVDLLEGWLYPKSLQPIMDRINACDITCFGGKLVLNTLNPFEKWIVNKVKATEGDFRDWQAVTAWAEKISE